VTSHTYAGASLYKKAFDTAARAERRDHVLREAIDAFRGTSRLAAPSDTAMRADALAMEGGVWLLLGDAPQAEAALEAPRRAPRRRAAVTRIGSAACPILTSYYARRRSGRAAREAAAWTRALQPAAWRLFVVVTPTNSYTLRHL
jgi:hypothetical protein